MVITTTLDGLPCAAKAGDSTPTAKSIKAASAPAGKEDLKEKRLNLCPPVAGAGGPARIPPGPSLWRSSNIPPDDYIEESTGENVLSGLRGKARRSKCAEEELERPDCHQRQNSRA
jgi:hypothetical protein